VNAADGFAPIALLLAGAAGALLLRQAWRDRGARQSWLTIAGWAVIATAIVAAFWLPGDGRGLFVALTYLPIGALAVVASGIQIREARGITTREGVLDPYRRHTNAWRAVARFFLAGPLSFLAASGTGIAYASFAGGDMQTRIVLGGLLVPAVWAGCMAWTLADDKILRSTAVICSVSFVAIGLSAWRFA
jgi:hypothetical protein